MILFVVGGGGGGGGTCFFMVDDGGGMVVLLLLCACYLIVWPCLKIHRGVCAYSFVYLRVCVCVFVGNFSSRAALEINPLNNMRPCASVK